MYDEEIDVKDAEEVDSGDLSSDSSIDNDSSRDLRTPSAKQRKLLVRSNIVLYTANIIAVASVRFTTIRRGTPDGRIKRVFETYETSAHGTFCDLRSFVHSQSVYERVRGGC